MPKIQKLIVLFLSILVVALSWFTYQQSMVARNATSELARAKDSAKNIKVGDRSAVEEITRLQAELKAAEAELSLLTASDKGSADITDLQTQLQSKDAEIARLMAEATAVARDAKDGEPTEDTDEFPLGSEENYQEFLDNLTPQEANALVRAQLEFSPEEIAESRARMIRERPREYQEMMERRVQVGVAMKQQLDERLLFYREFDLSGLPEETVQRHEELLKRLEEVGSTYSSIAADPENYPFNPSELREKLSPSGEIMGGLREILMQDLAVDLGFEGEDSVKLLETIDYIREITSLPDPKNVSAPDAPISGR